MAIPYTRRQLIQRIRQHIANGWPNHSFSASENEVQLYIDQAIAFAIVGKAYEGAKIEGALVIPEAFLITYNVGNLSLDSITMEWYATLPQPPLSLPLGYSINRVYFGSIANSISQEAYPIKAKRTSYRNDLPKPDGIYYRVENNVIKLQASNYQPLQGTDLYVQMPSARTSDVNEAMNIPDDALEIIFNNVIAKLKDRFMIPKDIVEDNLPSGNKAS